VSTGPHLLGRYVGFDLRKELLGEARTWPSGGPPDLPPDPLAGAAPVRALHEAQAALAAAGAWTRDDPARAIEQAEVAAGLAPDLPEPHKLLGDLVRARNPERARREYRRFLELHPPYLADVEAARAFLDGK
jgi:hypothetical protein